MTPFVSKMASQTNSLSGSMKGSMTNLMPQFPTTGPITKVTNVRRSDSSSESSFSTENLIDLDDLEQFDFLTGDQPLGDQSDDVTETDGLLTETGSFLTETGQRLADLRLTDQSLTEKPLIDQKLTNQRITKTDRRLTKTNRSTESENSNPNNQSTLAKHSRSDRASADAESQKNYRTPESQRQRTSRMALKLSASRPELSVAGRSSSMSNGGTCQPATPSSSARKPSNGFASSTRSSALKQKAKYLGQSMITHTLPSPATYRANRL